jgi:hypothetical protein
MESDIIPRADPKFAKKRTEVQTYFEGGPHF